MANGNYTTVSRTKILEFLTDNSDKSVNVQDINKHLTNQGIGVNITTIYRYLDKLEKDGRIMKYTSKDGQQAVYQYVEPMLKCSEHLHLQCVKCGAIRHLDCNVMKDFSENVRDNYGFKIQCKNSLIYGICENCDN